MAKKLGMELKVGLFVTIGVGLIAAAILALGSGGSFLSRKSHYSSHLPTAQGLITGAKVVIGGIPVGTVDSIRFDAGHHDIDVRFSVKKDYATWVRSDSSVEVLTQGVLGDKFVSLNPGNLDKPEVAENGEVPNKPTKDFSQFLSKGDQLMISLNNIALDLDRLLHAFEKDDRADVFFQNMSLTSKNLASLSEKVNRQMENTQIHALVKNLNGIMEKINNGSGTLGALVNDPALYDNVKSLVGGANRNRIIRNMVRKAVEEGSQAKPVEPQKQ